MTFKKFEQLVKQYCPKVEMVSQKSHTQDGGVMVCFVGGNRKAYIYQGSYGTILNRLGMKAVFDITIKSLHKMINDTLENANSDKPIYSLIGTPEYNRQQLLNYAESLKKQLAEYIGYVMINESGDVLGIYEGE